MPSYAIQCLPSTSSFTKNSQAFRLSLTGCKHSMRQTLKPSISAARLLPDSHSSVTNFADLKPTTRATIFMSYAFDWDRSITASLFFPRAHRSVVAPGLTKEAAVPATDIKQAITRKAAFIANPAAHTFKGEINDGEKNHHRRHQDSGGYRRP
jgi:hypothetical protein